MEGTTELLDTVGDKYPPGKDTISLCRCGESSKETASELANRSTTVLSSLGTKAKDGA